MMATGVLQRRPGHINIREARRNHLPANRSLTLAYTLSGVAAILLFVTSVAGLVFGQRGFYRPDPATMPHCSAGRAELDRRLAAAARLHDPGSTWIAGR